MFIRFFYIDFIENKGMILTVFKLTRNFDPKIKPENSNNKQQEKTRQIVNSQKIQNKNKRFDVKNSFKLIFPI